MPEAQYFHRHLLAFLGFGSLLLLEEPHLLFSGVGLPPSQQIAILVLTLIFRGRLLLNRIIISLRATISLRESFFP